MNKHLIKICLAALFTALLCALSPITIPTPLGVPLTLQTPLIALTAFLLGAKAGTAAVLCYVSAGLLGLPVFSGFGAGAGVIVSPTGGFIVAFPVFALILSLVFYVNKYLFRALICAGALTILYAAGTVQFILITGTGPLTALIGFLPYFIKDSLLLAGIYFLSLRIRPAIGALMQPRR